MKRNIAWVLCFVLVIGLLLTPAMAAYKVTFDLAGGEFVKMPEDYKTDYDVEKDAKIYVVNTDADAYYVLKDVEVSREGYSFKGWKIGDYAIGADYEIVGDVTVTATWESNGGDYPFYPSGGGSTPEAKTEHKTRTPGPTSFLDVHRSDWFYDNVMWASAEGLMIGYGNGYFGPNDPVTRAVLIQVLYNLAYGSVEKITTQYTDVKESDWYAAAATWALENGIGGRSATVFGADDVLSREQTMVILYTYAKGEPTEADLSAFDDVDDISAGARDAINWAVSNDVMRGMDNGKLEPQGVSTRAQLAALLNRICTKA